MRQTNLLVMALGAAALASSAEAGVSLVNFDPSAQVGWIETTRTADVYTSTATTGQRAYNFSTTTPFFNTGNSQFDFYGGWKSDFPGAANGDIVNNPPVLQNTGFGGFYGETGGPGSTLYTITTFALWQKTNFLNGGDANPVSFDATTTLSVNGGDFSEPGGLRYVIRNGATYYVSETLVLNPWTPNIGTLADFNNNSASGKGWAEWTPSASDFSLPTPGAFAAVNFDDVTGVGIVQLAGRDQYHGSFYLKTFSVDNAVVPEPAALGLIGLGSLLAMRRRRAD